MAWNERVAEPCFKDPRRTYVVVTQEEVERDCERGSEEDNEQEQVESKLSESKETEHQDE